MRPAFANRSRPPRRVEWRGAAGNTLVGECFDAPGPVGVALLHGGGQTRHAWRRAARWLQERGTPCLTFDQRGHGDSAWIDDGDYRLDVFRDDLHAVLGQWNRPCVLIGASLGGLVSLMAAGTPSARIRGLVMIDTAPQLDHAEIEWLIDFLGGDAEQGFESPAAAVEHLRRFFPDLVIAPESIEKSLRRDAQGRWHRHWDVRVVLGERNSVAIGHEARLHADASRIEVPAMLVRAGASQLVSDEAVGQLRAVVPQLELLEMPGLHHLFSGDESLEIMARIEPFLQRACTA